LLSAEISSCVSRATSDVRFGDVAAVQLPRTILAAFGHELPIRTVASCADGALVCERRRGNARHAVERGERSKLTRIFVGATDFVELGRVQPYGMSYRSGRLGQDGDSAVELSTGKLLAHVARSISAKSTRSRSAPDGSLICQRRVTIARVLLWTFRA
jgi:hypothetical protein